MITSVVKIQLVHIHTTIKITVNLLNQFKAISTNLKAPIKTFLPDLGGYLYA